MVFQYEVLTTLSTGEIIAERSLEEELRHQGMDDEFQLRLVVLLAGKGILTMGDLEELLPGKHIVRVPSDR